MDDELLPYLQYLRTVLDDVRAEPISETAASRLDIARRLLDSMIARSTALPLIRSGFYTKLSALTEDIRDKLGDSRQDTNLAPALIAFETEKPGHDGKIFSDFLRHLKAIQRELTKSAHPTGFALAKSIVSLEKDLHARFKSAVADEANAKASPSSRTAPGALFAREVDVPKLTAFLRSELREPDLTIEGHNFLAGGFSKLTLALKLSDVRAPFKEVILRSDSTAIHSAGSVISEYALLRVLFEDGICVPRPLAMEPTGAVFGAPFIVVEKKPGVAIGSLLHLPQPNAAVARDVASHLARLHQVPADHVTNCLPAPTATASEWILAQVDENYRNWNSLNICSSIYETAFAWLRRNAAINDRAPRSLIHGDYGLQNILISEDKVSAILDWEFACVGHAAYDLGYFFDQAESLSSWEDFLDAYAQAGGPRIDRDILDYNILLTATHFGVMSLRMMDQFTKSGKIDDSSASLVGQSFVEEFAGRAAHALQRVLP